MTNLSVNPIANTTNLFNQVEKRNIRYNFIDLLRGFGLMGLAIVHYLQWHTSGPLNQEILINLKISKLDKIISLFSQTFISYKFFAIFSFVFGLNFYLQLNKKGSLSDVALRIVLLLVFGIIHHIFWRGDILIIYATVAIVLFLLRNLPRNLILFISAFCILNIPGMLLSYYLGIQTSNMKDLRYHEVILNGSLLDIIQFNLFTTFQKFEFQIISGRIFITLGYFLLGMFIGKMNWHQLLPESKHHFKNIFIICLSLLFIIYSVGFFTGGNEISFFMRQAGNLCLTLLIITSLALFYYIKKMRIILDYFLPIGKMSLTNYLIQTLFGLIIFYGIGFGLYGKTNATINFSISIAVFLFQMIFSNIWLNYFNYGVLEWIWRSAYKRQWQPFLKTKFK